MTNGNNFFAPKSMIKRAGRRAGYPVVTPLSRQRGAIGIFGGLVGIMVILFAALSIDSGRLMMEHRSLQRIADMAAMDAASRTGSCGDGATASAAAAAQASAARNGYSGDLTGGVVLGTVATNAGLRTFTPSDPAIATAVQVTAPKTVPASLVAGGIFAEQVTLSAVGVARRTAIAGFSAGSGLLTFDSQKSAILNLLLNQILGTHINLAAVTYNGIANTQITLGDLRTALGVGTVNELLAANLSLGELFQLTLDAVNQAGVANAEVTLLLNQLIAANVSGLGVQLGDVINVTAPDLEAAATAHINVLDLITTSVLIANGDNAITLPLGINLPGGLLSVQALLKVIEPPQIAIGPPGKDAGGNWITEARTAQIALTIGINSTINLILFSANVDLGINVTVAQGNAHLTSIQCPSANNPEAIVTIGAQPGIASVSITKADGTGSVGNILVRLLFLNLASVDVGLNLPIEPSSTDLQFQVDLNDPGSLPQQQQIASPIGGSLNNALNPDSLTPDVTLLGGTLSVGQILGTLVSGLLAPLLSGLATLLLDPLLSILGIEVGTLNVVLFSLDLSRPVLLI